MLPDVRLVEIGERRATGVSTDEVYEHVDGAESVGGCGQGRARGSRILEVGDHRSPAIVAEPDLVRELEQPGLFHAGQGQAGAIRSEGSGRDAAEPTGRSGDRGPRDPHRPWLGSLPRAAGTGAGRAGRGSAGGRNTTHCPGSDDVASSA